LVGVVDRKYPTELAERVVHQAGFFPNFTLVAFSSITQLVAGAEIKYFLFPKVVYPLFSILSKKLE